MQGLTLSAATALALVTPALAQEAAMATFIDADGMEIGSVTLSQSDDGVTVSGELVGIPPGEHGFHFHETGDCDSAGGFESAGDHFNPTSHQHGHENPEGPHAGDLPNVTAGEDGTVAVDLTTAGVSLSVFSASA